MPVNLPSLTELQNVQFMDPMMFQQAQDQIGLGNQFAQQGLQKGEADLQQQVLANLFAEQNNPQRLEQQRLQNEGTGFQNQSLGVKARTDVDLEEENKTAKRAELLKSASEDDLKRLQAQAEAEMLNPDPVVQARGQKKLEGSWQELQRRNKAADALKNTETIVGGRKEVAGINADAKKEAAQVAADAKAAKGASATDFEALILKYATSPTKQAEIRISRAEQLAANGDAAGAARQLQLAAEARARAAEDTSNRGLATPGVDVPALSNLPAADRPAARATVGTVGPASTNPNPVTTNARGNPTQLGDNAGPAQILNQELRQAQQRLAQATSPDDQRRAQEDIAGIQKELSRLPGAKKTAAPPGGSLADVSKMYPGVPAEKLREAYKKKFGVDLK